MRRFWSVLISGQSTALSVHLFGQSQPPPHEFKRFGHCPDGTQHADIKRGKRSVRNVYRMQKTSSKDDRRMPEVEV